MSALQIAAQTRVQHRLHELSHDRHETDRAVVIGALRFASRFAERNDVTARPSAGPNAGVKHAIEQCTERVAQLRCSDFEQFRAHTVVPDSAAVRHSAKRSSQLCNFNARRQPLLCARHQREGGRGVGQRRRGFCR